MDRDGRATRAKAEVLAARARLLARPLETTSWDHLATQLVGFDAGEGRFVVPTASVVSVISSVPPTPLPEQPGWLAGAAAVGGQVLMVLEPDRFLGATSRQAELDGRATLIVISDGTAEIAMLVDRLAPVDSSATSVEPLPDGTPDRVASVIRGVVGGRHLLDVAGLVTAIRTALQPSANSDTSAPARAGEPRQ
jgi:chemotaxis signal transduction protein